jgi:hypothetical protein
MISLGKIVTFSAPSLANLGHFAVCTLLFGASRHTSKYLSKSGTVIFTKASMEVIYLGKLLHRHEASNGSSVQKGEHRAAHEILRKHHGEKRRRRRRMLLRILSTSFRFLRFHSCHAGADCFLEIS